MKKIVSSTSNLMIFGFFGLAVACSDTASNEVRGTHADRVVLDVRCSTDSECPTGFECEVEQEHGTSTSYCKSHVEDGAASAPATASGCPAGFELELEEGRSLCKPHNSDSSNDDSSASATSNGATSANGGAAGTTCARSSDCAAGLECETEVEHGVTTSTCKAHGGKK